MSSFLGPEPRRCHCGSGLYSYELLDARGIYCGRVCDRCEAEKRKEFRADIFTDSSYGSDEPIEEGDSYGAPYDDV